MINLLYALRRVIKLVKRQEVQVNMFLFADDIYCARFFYYRMFYLVNAVPQ